MSKELNIFFLGVTDTEGSANRAYSNFVYALCKKIIKDYNQQEKTERKYNLSTFKRHDMLQEAANIRDSVYSILRKTDVFICLLDAAEDDNNASFGDNAKATSPTWYNQNVWFELGRASVHPNKGIILIAKPEVFGNLPFYVSDVNCVVIPNGLYTYFRNNRSLFQNTSLFTKDEPYDFGSTLDALGYSSFCAAIQGKLSAPQNPFQTLEDDEMKSFVEDEALKSPYDIIRSMYENSKKAEFFDSEEKAFKELISEINAFLNDEKRYQDSNTAIRTSRFANQSIVSSESQVDDFHKQFMDALYAVSEKGIRNKRIICNNNPTKIADMYEFLSRCNNPDSTAPTELYVRKKDYNIRFEIVIIGSDVMFLHFYDLKEKIEKINSTFKVRDRKICEKWISIYDSLIEEGDPSRFAKFTSTDINAIVDRDPIKTMFVNTINDYLTRGTIDPINDEDFKNFFMGVVQKFCDSRDLDLAYVLKHLGLDKDLAPEIELKIEEYINEIIDNNNQSSRKDAE